MRAEIGVKGRCYVVHETRLGVDEAITTRCPLGGESRLNFRGDSGFLGVVGRGDDGASFLTGVNDITFTSSGSYVHE